MAALQAQGGLFNCPANPHFGRIMTHHILHRSGVPDDVASLLGDYPREAWPKHPHFARSIANWMGAHAGFRSLGQIARSETEAFLDQKTDGDTFAAALSKYGNLLVHNLHGHHTWEDHSFFPELGQADPRFENGLAMLEGDHVVLDEVLDRFTRQSNRVIKLLHLDPPQGAEEARQLRDTTSEIERFLNRHLSDEEDLVVPLLLHHKLRG
jgi:iron-sulfur cluster repair protein YtfE (RIC family)